MFEARPMNSSARLLGLAFAAADALFEVADGQVVFAIGGGVVADADPAACWTGQALDELVDAADRAAIGEALAVLRPGERTPPMAVAMRADGGWIRRGALRLFALPELSPAVSGAIVWTGAASRSAAALLDAGGLLKRLTAALDRAAQGLAVEFVEVPGLDAPDPPHQRASATIRDRLQAASWEGASAAALGADRFAVLRSATDVEDLAGIVRAAGAAEGLDLSPLTSRGELADAEAAVAIRTLRLALEACLKDGAAAGARFDERLKRTVREADRFRTLVRERDFTLVYQPIVSLATRKPHHFEALVRFDGGDRAPAASISMAEELGLTESFDLAVAEQALLELRRDGSTRARIAVNVSALSLASDRYVEGLLRMTELNPALRPRLMVEVTETAALADVDAADRRLAALRAAGVHVCLDDFGVGAASLDHLRRLGVDLVKIDGSFVRNIADPRARTLAAAIVDLCRELKVPTVAEMVETEAQDAALGALGVDFGQGWLYGRPGPRPIVLEPAPAAARRRGEVVAWG